MKIELSPFESTVQILGDRVLLRAVPKESPIVQIGAEHKLIGDIVIVAVGDGPRMKDRFAALQVGAKVAVTDIGFKELLDPEAKRVLRTYSAEDIIAILPD